MTDQAALPPPPQVSPDGRFWWNGTVWVAMQTTTVSAKNPLLHLLVSVIIPGLGSILAGRVRRGWIILGSMVGIWVVSLVAMTLMFSVAASSIHPACTTVNSDHGITSYCSDVSINVFPAFGGSLTIFALVSLASLGLWVFGLVDAYRAAEEWNATHGIIS